MEKMSYRDKMRECGENLGWCKPVKLTNKGKTAIVAINEGEIAGMILGGKDVSHDREKMFAALCDHLGTEASSIYDLDVEEYEEGPCHSCPWFDTCDAMDG